MSKLSILQARGDGTTSYGYYYLATTLLLQLLLLLLPLPKCIKQRRCEPTAPRPRKKMGKSKSVVSLFKACHPCALNGRGFLALRVEAWKRDSPLDLGR